MASKSWIGLSRGPASPKAAAVEMREIVRKPVIPPSEAADLDQAVNLGRAAGSEEPLASAEPSQRAVQGGPASLESEVSEELPQEAEFAVPLGAGDNFYVCCFYSPPRIFSHLIPLPIQLPAVIGHDNAMRMHSLTIWNLCRFFMPCNAGYAPEPVPGVVPAAAPSALPPEAAAPSCVDTMSAPLPEDSALAHDDTGSADRDTTGGEEGISASAEGPGSASDSALAGIAVPGPLHVAQGRLISYSDGCRVP